MKRAFYITVTLLCITAAAFAAKKGKKQAPPPQAEFTALPSGITDTHGLFLDVNDEGGDHQSGHSTGKTWAGGRKDVSSMRRDKTLAIQARNSGTGEQSVMLEWFFVSLDIGTGHKHIFDRGSKELSLPPGGADSSEVTSAEIQSTHVSKNGIAHANGSRIEGWIVRLIEEGHVLVQKCSDSGIEAITRDEAKVQKLQSPAGLAE